MVDPEADEFGTADVFLDDIFSAIPQLDGDSTGDRGAQAALLALDVLGRPLLPDSGESLPRDEVLAIDKAIAEGTPAERLIVLGWMIDTRRLLISPPTYSPRGRPTSTTSCSPRGAASSYGPWRQWLADSSTSPTLWSRETISLAVFEAQ